ncbi:MAG: hypothetical protein EBU01_10235 [Crocinitomicaceae bacterium]|nr:hypothetical protein [Crocinitomicaceae bacterium]
MFTTDEQQRHSDEYFLNSGETISYFVEEKAVSSSGELLHRKEDCINKMGHNLHELCPEMKAVSLEDPRIGEICRAFGYEKPVVCQSMYIVKPAFIGGAVRPHVDGAFLYTSPQSVLGFCVCTPHSTLDDYRKFCLTCWCKSRRSGRLVFGNLHRRFGMGGDYKYERNESIF